MNAAMLVIVVGASLAGLAVALNQALARLALVEVTLSEGLPPGHASLEAAVRQGPEPTAAQSAALLERGLHVFLSRSCHACQRLVDELAVRHLDTAVPVALHYVDRPRPLSREVASHLGATLAEEQAELAHAVGADPLPYTIAVGEHGLITRSVTPTVALIADTARDAGIPIGAAS
ncbi:MAG: hypothetical protein AAF567_07745 [Actinomycetota bacterium]